MVISEKAAYAALAVQASNVPIQIALTAILSMLINLLIAKCLNETRGLTYDEKGWVGATLIAQGFVLVASLIWIVWTRL